jgi:hypothetical protein
MLMEEGIYRSTFSYSALIGEKFLESRSGRFIPRKRIPVPIAWEVGWALDAVQMTWKSKRSRA